jgi:uncharacterized membrane protein (UPF0127 family)
MRALWFAAALGVASVGGAVAAKPPAAKTEAGLVSLTISTAKRQHVFKVEVARTEAEQERGLMFRTHLGPDRGMIFPMSPARYASFWMKNTLIPLDMIFIRFDGTIARIAPMTVPRSLQPVGSGEPVAAVLEIAGGRAAQLGISINDRVTWPR